MYNSFDFFFFLSLLFAVGGTVQQPGISAKRALIFLTGKMRCVCDGQLGYFPVVQLRSIHSVRLRSYVILFRWWRKSGVESSRVSTVCHVTARRMT